MKGKHRGSFRHCVLAGKGSRGGVASCTCTSQRFIQIGATGIRRAFSTDVEAPSSISFFASAGPIATESGVKLGHAGEQSIEAEQSRSSASSTSTTLSPTPQNDSSIDVESSSTTCTSTTSTTSSTVAASIPENNIPPEKLGHWYCRDFPAFLKRGVAVSEWVKLRRAGGRLDAGGKRFLLEKVRESLEDHRRPSSANNGSSSIEPGPPAPAGSGLADNKKPSIIPIPHAAAAATTIGTPTRTNSLITIKTNPRSSDLALYPIFLRQLQIDDEKTIEQMLDRAVEQLASGEMGLVHQWTHRGAAGPYGHGRRSFSSSGGPGILPTSGSAHGLKTSSKKSSNGTLSAVKLPPVPRDPKGAIRLPSEIEVFVRGLMELPVEFRGMFHAARKFVQKLANSEQQGEGLEKWPVSNLCLLFSTLSQAMVPFDRMKIFYTLLHQKLIVEDGSGGGAAAGAASTRPGRNGFASSVTAPTVAARLFLRLSPDDRRVVLEVLTPLVFDDHGSARMLNKYPFNVAKQMELLRDFKFFLGQEFRKEVEECTSVRDLEIRCCTLLRYFTDPSYQSLFTSDTASDVEPADGGSGNALEIKSTSEQEKQDASSDAPEPIFSSSVRKQEQHVDPCSSESLLHLFVDKAKTLAHDGKKALPEVHYSQLLWHTRGLPAWARAAIAHKWLIEEKACSTLLLDGKQVSAPSTTTGLYLYAKWLEMLSGLDDSDLSGVTKIREQLKVRVTARKTTLLTPNIAVSLLLSTQDMRFLDHIEQWQDLSPGDLKKLCRLEQLSLRREIVRRVRQCAINSHLLGGDSFPTRLTGATSTSTEQRSDSTSAFASTSSPHKNIDGVKTTSDITEQANSSTSRETTIDALEALYSIEQLMLFSNLLPASSSIEDGDEQLQAARNNYPSSEHQDLSWQQGWSVFDLALQRKLHACNDLAKLNEVIATMSKSGKYESSLLSGARNKYVCRVLKAGKDVEYL
ncbi:unnamed protein product [Amoebophrya sp. A25]|nr:unnamed protein product [Amoebophrya sp. A25]|eukprot:GSA25T00010147001.1